MAASGAQIWHLVLQDREKLIPALHRGECHGVLPAAVELFDELGQFCLELGLPELPAKLPDPRRRRSIPAFFFATILVHKAPFRLRSLRLTTPCWFGRRNCHAECVLDILAPVAYAMCLARTHRGRKATDPANVCSDATATRGDVQHDAWRGLANGGKPRSFTRLLRKVPELCRLTLPAQGDLRRQWLAKPLPPSSSPSATP